MLFTIAHIIRILLNVLRDSFSRKMDDYCNEPLRKSDLVVNAPQPFNAEPPPKVLCNSFYTPKEYFYVRNHAPVPKIDVRTYRLEIVGQVRTPLNITLEDLIKNFRSVNITAALMCAGNRRNELKAIKPINGVGWSQGAISNAHWRGVKLRDVLIEAGVDESNPSLHVWFEGADRPKETPIYQTSVSINKVMDPYGDVILAYEMNNEPLTPDHGYPLRVIVPGYIGARSVKWLTRITVSDQESSNFFQLQDYKIYMPQAGMNSVEEWFSKVPPVQEMNVQSAICIPEEGQIIPTGSSFTIKGYAVAGGGRRIFRVDVSLDGGHSWKLAKLTPHSEIEDHAKRHWGWTLWECYVPHFPSPCQLVSRAWDVASNTQPKYAEDIWNIRGVMNNAWYRVNVAAPSRL